MFNYLRNAELRNPCNAFIFSQSQRFRIPRFRKKSFCHSPACHAGLTLSVVPESYSGKFRPLRQISFDTFTTFPLPHNSFSHQRPHHHHSTLSNSLILFPFPHPRSLRIHFHTKISPPPTLSNSLILYRSHRSASAAPLV